jgi:predicted NBD/HSP70 family sugar kinase
MEKNARRILARLIEKGGATLPELADTLDISIGTVTKEIASLQQEGLVRDTGKIDTNSGRKPRLYDLNPEAGYFAGIDLNDNYVSLAIIDMAGNTVRQRTNVAYKLENTTAALHTLAEIVHEHKRRIPQYLGKIRRMCVNIPGRINIRSGYSHTNFNFTDRPLTDILTGAFGIPASICNDTMAMAYAEFMKCCRPDEQNIIFINANWGLGAGLILNGRPYFGKSGYSGEFGHIHAFENDIICRCGKKGCLETEVSGMALRRKLTERIRHGESSILSDRVLQSDSPLSLEEITDAVHREDALCIDAIDEIGTLLGVQVASMINIFNPDAVIIGGELAMTGDYLLQPLKTSVNKHVLNRVREDTVIRTSQLGEDAGVLGGCLMARSIDFGLL